MPQGPPFGNMDRAALVHRGIGGENVPDHKGPLPIINRKSDALMGMLFLPEFS